MLRFVNKALSSCSCRRVIIYFPARLQHSLFGCIRLTLFSSPPFVSIHRDLPQRPTAEAQACVSWLAHLMVRLQEEGSLISPWSLMAILLLQAPITVLTGDGLLWQQLTEKTLWLRRLALDCGARLNWPGG